MGTITLQNVRATSDITIKTRLKDGGLALDWSGLTDIKAWIYSDAQKALAGRCVVSVDQEDTTLLLCEYSAQKPQYLGVNRLIVQCKLLGRTKTYDKPAFNLVSRTAQLSGEEVVLEDPVVEVEIVVEDVSSSILDAAILAAIDAAERANDAAEAAEHMVDIHTGPQGPAGKPPYIGENGNWFEWDEDTDQYVDTEVKAHGDTGDTGATPDITIGTVTTGAAGSQASASMGGTPEDPVLNMTIPRGDTGAEGKSAYEVAVEEGFVGTEQDWLASLKGDTGVSADHPITIHNGVDSDATDEALAALQGKLLNNKVTQLEAKVDGLNEDISDADVHQVATGSDVDSATGTRLRVIFQVKPGYKVSASCTAGKGLTMNCYDTLSKALKCSSGTSNQLVSGGVWIPHCTGEIRVNGYLTISLCKSDSSAFSAQEKQDFIDATTVTIWTDSLIALLPSKPKTDKLIVKVGKNLLNPSDPNVLVDYYISGGTITAGAGYTTSGYIPVSPSTTYYKAQDAEHSLRYVEYYDSNKTYISQNTSADSFTTPVNCAFVRVSMNSLSWAKAQVSLESIDFVPYSEFLSLTDQTGPYNDSIATKKYVDDSVAGIDVGDLPSIKAKTDELVLKDGANILNQSDPDVLVDYYIDGGYAYASEGYTSSGWIPVTAETKYYKASNDPGSFRFVNFYNSSKTYLSKTAYAEEFTTPVGCAYVRVSKNSTYWSVAQLALSSIPFTPYGKFLALAKQTGTDDASITTKKYVDDGLSNVANQVFDSLRGKKWAVLGDSFTEGATSNTIPDGQYAGKRKVYPYFIGNRTGMNVLNTFFASGRTLAWPAVPGTFTNSICNPDAACYYQNIPADVDYITIYLGINDSHHSPGSDGGDGEDNTGEIPIGTINDNTTATYYGAWNVVLTWLRTNRPFAHIGIIVSNGCDTMDYRTAQIEVAKKYGIPYLDLNGDDRCPAMIRPQNDDIPSAVKTIIAQAQAVDYDGTQTGTINRHPNDEAHLFESYFIESFLRTI